jgi:hypothetical protein
MKKADNFDAKQWLVENKITFQSRLNEDEEEKKYYLSAKSKDGKKHEVFKKNPNYIKTTYDSALELINSLKKPKHYIYYVSDIDGNPVDKNGNIINESRLNEEQYSSERVNPRDVETASGEVINHTFDTVDMIDLDNGYKVKITTTYYFRDPGVKGYTSTASDENPMLSGVKTTLMDPSGKPIKNHNFTGSGQWWMLQGGKEYFMPQIKAWWENKMGKLGLSESRLNENEEFSSDFPSLDYNTITNFIKSKGYKITSDYYDSGFDVNNGEYFVGVFDDHIAVTGDDGQTKEYFF